MNNNSNESNDLKDGLVYIRATMGISLIYLYQKFLAEPLVFEGIVDPSGTRQSLKNRCGEIRKRFVISPHTPVEVSMCPILAYNNMVIIISALSRSSSPFHAIHFDYKTIKKY